MKVKNIMKKAASLLGNADDLLDYLNGVSGVGNTGEKQAELLLNCFNLVENELALDYLPLIKKESYTPQNGKIFYSQFSSSVVRILDVENELGQKVDFRLFATYMEVDATVANVRYAYTPTEKAINGESDYKLAASERLLAFGMAAEYLSALGLLEEASVWDKKYKEGIQAAIEWDKKCEAEKKAALNGEEEPDCNQGSEETPENKPFVSASGRMPTRWWV